MPSHCKAAVSRAKLCSKALEHTSARDGGIAWTLNCNGAREKVKLILLHQTTFSKWLDLQLNFDKHEITI
jgi:hypothetical protein